jgi:hypothetical protein
MTVTSRYGYLKQAYAAKRAPAAQAAALTHISLLVISFFIENKGFGDTPAGRTLDAIDDVLLALDESGKWPNEPKSNAKATQTQR